MARPPFRRGQPVAKDRPLLRAAPKVISPVERIDYHHGRRLRLLDTRGRTLNRRCRWFARHPFPKQVPAIALLGIEVAFTPTKNVIDLIKRHDDGFQAAREYL